jgi:uncharacterized membrane protein YphA (DoxX/SURF4 family)
MQPGDFRLVLNMRMKTLFQHTCLPFVLRVLTAVIFLLSGVSKLSGIDDFEIYVYSLGLFSLDMSFLLARLLISLEFFLAGMLVSGLWLRRISLFSILLLAAFSAFLLYLIWVGDKEHCHCFGEILQMSHPLSLLKNGVFILLLLPLLKQGGSRSPYSGALAAFIFLTSLALPLILSPPDHFRYAHYARKTTYDQEALQHFLEANPGADTRRVLCFYGVSCRFCKLAARKVRVVAEKTGKQEHIELIFWGDEAGIQSFLNETQFSPGRYASLEGPAFLRITEGRMPLMLLLQGDSVVAKYRYRDFREQDLREFLTKM